MHEEVVDVDNDVRDIGHSQFHHALKGARTTLEAHAEDLVLELSLPRAREGSQLSRAGGERELPEAGGEVHGTKNGGISTTDFPYTLTNILHAVTVVQACVVEGAIVEDEAEGTILLRHHENRRVEPAEAWLNYPDFDPLVNLRMQRIAVEVRNPKLFPVDRVCGWVLQHHSVLEIVSRAEVMFVNAKDV
jgi:hypothetical protein